MKTHHLFFLLAAVLTLMGCDSFGGRLNQGSISGRAVSTMDRTVPVPFAKVVIYIADGCTQSYDPECWVPVDSTIADEQGLFQLDYEIPVKNSVLVAKGYKDQYFEVGSPTIFGLASTSVDVSLTPKTYFKVHIKDELPYDYSRYVGMWLSHTTFVPNDTIYQYPLDTVVVVEGSPKLRTGGSYPYNPLAYSLVYDRPNTVGSLNVLHNMQCPPFDTCEVWIKF